MNDKNLIPNSERTPEELREITRKGGIASGVARRKKADLRKQLEMLGSLRMEVTPNVAKILDGMDKDISIDRDNLTNETMVLIALMQKAKSGDVKASALYAELRGSDAYTVNHREALKLEREKLKLEREKLELEKQAMRVEEEQEQDGDGFMDAMNAFAEEVFVNGADIPQNIDD